jgi:hypothetical protein
MRRIYILFTNNPPAACGGDPLIEGGQSISNQGIIHPLSREEKRMAYISPYFKGDTAKPRGIKDFHERNNVVLNNPD